MGFRETKVGQLIRTGQYDKAAALVNAAIRTAGGNATRAATALGVSHDALTRWVAKLTDAGHKIEERRGPGRPAASRPGGRVRARKPRPGA